MLSIDEIVSTLNLKRQGRGYGGSCPSCGYQTGFSVMERHGRILFCCHAGGCSYKEIRQTLTQEGLLPQPKYESNAKNNFANSPYDPTRAARQLWEQSHRAENTLVETYLKKRGYVGAIPKSIRFLPECWHSAEKKCYPAMLAGITQHPSSDIKAVHRTFLTPDGKQKANVTPNKMSLGPLAGAAVHITPPCETLAIAEGLETSLTVRMLGNIATWCALSASGMKALILPPLPLARYVHIFADKDTNFVGQEAAEAAAKRWSLEGRKVKILTPKQWETDFNDLLSQKENPHALG